MQLGLYCNTNASTSLIPGTVNAIAPTISNTKFDAPLISTFISTQRIKSILIAESAQTCDSSFTVFAIQASLTIQALALHTTKNIAANRNA